MGPASHARISAFAVCGRRVRPRFARATGGVVRAAASMRVAGRLSASERRSGIATTGEPIVAALAAHSAHVRTRAVRAGGGGARLRLLAR
jgi:hypothetical protein